MNMKASKVGKLNRVKIRQFLSKNSRGVAWSVLVLSAVLTITVLVIDNTSRASWNNTITWSTKSDFENNTVTTGTPTDRLLVDISEDNKVRLIKPNTIGNTISVGYYHSLFVKEDATLWGSGRGYYGNFGLGDDNRTSTNSFIQINEDVASVEAGLDNSFIIKKDGNLWVAGRNQSGVLGFGHTSNVPEWTQTSLTNVRQVSSAHSFAIVLDNDGNVWRAGLNDYGQLATGDTTSVNTWTLVTDPNIIPTSNNKVEYIATGASSSYLVKTDGTVWVAGRGDLGALGLANPENKTVFTQTSLTNIVKVSANGDNAIALDSNGDVFVAGRNAQGNLGVGSMLIVDPWVKTNISDVIDIAAGLNHSVVFKENKEVFVAGAGTLGQLGIGITSVKTNWTKVNVSDATDIVAGANSTIIRKSDGLVYATGQNNFGQLGFSGQQVYYGDWQQTNITNAKSINSGSNSQYVIRNNNTLFGTGSNSIFQLGIGTITDFFGFTMLPVASGNIKKVVGGYLSSHLLYDDGMLYNTGYNGYGQFGVGNTTTRTGYTLNATNNISDISIDYLHTVILKTDGSVWTAGYNASGQLGRGNTTTSYSFIQALDTNSNPLTDVKAIGSSYCASYAVKNNGELWVAGCYSNGQLGIGPGSTANRTRFTLSTAISDIDKIWTGGNSHTIVQKTDGTLWGVGNNANGVLATGNYTGSTSWIQFDESFNNPVDVSVSSHITFIIKSDNTLWVSGLGYFGELGTGNIFEKRNTFIKVADDVKAIDSHTNYQVSSNRQSILIKTDGTVWTAGIANSGELGFEVEDNGQKNYLEEIITNIKKPGGYYNTGKISNLRIDAGEGNIYKWNSISWVGDTSNDSQIKFRTRGANSEEALVETEWSDYYTTSGSKISSDKSRLLEIEATIFSSDGLTTPVLDQMSINYFTDVINPSNPEELASAWSGSNKTKSINNNGYSNAQKPYFEFSGASDEFGGSGLKGYYIYFGASDTADPFTAGSFLSHQESDPQAFTPSTNLTTDGPYYLRIRTIDNADNKSEPITLFTYNFDKTPPTSPNSLNVTPFGWSRTNNFSFNYDSGYDEALYASGLQGYQYKFGGNSTDWSGEVFFTDQLTIQDIEAYQDGQNIIYLRAIDGAGNTSTIKQAYFYYNGQAPSIPRNLSVNPQSSNTDNSFTFYWDEPESYNGSIKGYRYSVNALPQANNSTFINLSDLPPEASYNSVTGRVTLSNIPAATLQGQNYFYIVAVDSNDNVAYGDNSARVGFECVTPAPGSPVGLEIFDTSNRDQQKFSVALNWSEPSNKGVGFKDYVIERSIDGVNYSLAGSSAGNSFIDTGLQSQKYYYRVFTRDNSGNTSISSQVVNKVPTGRYTSPPVITVPPEVVAKVTTATVRWVTDRPASSFVVASEVPDFDATKNQQGQQDNEVEHIVNLAGLKPDTSYYYRVVYTDSDGNSNVNNAENFTFKTLPAPRIERVSVQDIRLNTAIISWYTSEPAQTDLLYGKTTNYSSELKNISGGSTTAHTIRIEGLDHSSSYHFAIKVKDVDGNQIMSDDYTFETLMFPKISNVRFEPLKDKSTSTFKITWQSNVPTNSIVRYQPEGGNNQEVVSSELKTEHELVVSNLMDNKYYIFNVFGVDQYGNQAESETNRVKTDYDTRPPAIFNITSEVSNSEFGKDAKGQVVISWETDEPATSQVEYSIGSTGDNYETKSQEDASLSTSHVVIVNGLRPSSTYRFRVVSSDASGNRSFSPPQSIITEQARSSVLDIIIKSLQDSIGWLFGVGQ